jgi:CheY-like chemotaxis protein
MAHGTGRGQHVLVFEDNDAMRDLYRELLEEEGYRLTLAANPEMEPADVAALAPDLIVLDLLFGRRSRGIELLDALQSDPRTRHIPVLVCSADTTFLTERRDELAARTCGAIAKPFGLDTLLAAVRGCLLPPAPTAE